MALTFSMFVRGSPSSLFCYDYKAVRDLLRNSQTVDRQLRQVWARKLLKVASSTLEVLFDDGKDLIRRKSWMHSGCSPSVVVNSWWKLLLSIRQRFTKTLRAPLSFISNWISWNETHRLSSRQSFVFSSVCFMQSKHCCSVLLWLMSVSACRASWETCPVGSLR